MMAKYICPQCGHVTRHYRNPVPTVDIIIEYQEQGIVLIERGKPPYGWALPGGFENMARVWKRPPCGRPEKKPVLR